MHTRTHVIRKDNGNNYRRKKLSCVSTYHDGDEVTLVVWQWAMGTLEDGVMHGEEGGEILGVITHHLDHVLQSAVVHERVHKQLGCLQQPITCLSLRNTDVPQPITILVLFYM